MPELIYTIDPLATEDGLTRHSQSSMETHYRANYSASLNLSTNSHQLKIRISNNLAESYSYSSWGSTADNNIEIYGYRDGVIDKTVVLTASDYYQTVLVVGNVFCKIHDVSIVRNDPLWGITGITCNDNTEVYNVTFVRLNLSCSTSGGFIHNNISTSHIIGFRPNEFGNSRLINNTAINGEQGFYASALYEAVTFINNISFGNTVANYVGITNVTAASKNNFGASGNTIPGSNPMAVLVSSDFKDFGGAIPDYRLSTNSQARHTHISFPTGNNTFAGVIVDYDGNVYPSYVDDSNRWDAGYVYYVDPVTGTTWRIRDSELTNNEATLSDATTIESVLDGAVTSTLGAVSSSTNKDTLKIISSVKATLDDYTQEFALRGLAIDIEDGELILSNTASYGMQWWGWKNKLIKPQALGKITIDGAKVALCVVGDLVTGTWATFWGSNQDDLENYPEPAVLFVGTSTGSAVPYFNKGNVSRTITTDSVHGKVFSFNATTGAITFPNHVPNSAYNIYIYNTLIHSKDGQSTNLTSFGFDTLLGGKVDLNNCYFTGSCKFNYASQLNLYGFGIIQPLSIDSCSTVTLDVYRGLSSANSMGDKSVIKNILNENLGSYSAVCDQTGLEFYQNISCTFTALFLQLLVAQTASNYLLVSGASIAGTDNCDFGDITVLGGGVNLTSSINIGTIIQSITHSNDCSGTNTSNSQHILFVSSAGSRDLTVNSITGVGLPTQLDIGNINNSGNFRITNINYGNCRNIVYFSGCFAGMISGFVVGQIAGQPFKFKGDCKDITVQNGYSTATGSIASFDYYVGKNIRMKNVPYQATAEYLLSGWSNVAIPDLNFLELNKFGSPYTGVLVQNFYRSSKGEFTFAGNAKSNQLDAVLLPSAADTVAVQTPPLKVGSHTTYFGTTAVTLLGVNTGNLSATFRSNINNAGFGVEQQLSSTNLRSIILSAGDEVVLEITVTCVTASATNAIKQIVISTLPDQTVIYYADSYTLTLASQNGNDLSDAQVSLYDANSAVIGSLGDELTESNESLANFTFVHYGITNSIYIQVIKPGYIEQLIPFTLSAENQTVYIALKRDENE